MVYEPKPYLKHQKHLESEKEAEEDEFMDQLMFVPIAGSGKGCQGYQGTDGGSSSASRIPNRRTAITLDDDDDTRVVAINETAGKEYGDGQTIKESWRERFAKKNKDGVGGNSGRFSLAVLVVPY